MEKIVSLCKRRGFIYPSSEIYGGINGFWDYGPLGAELKRNVKELWWNTMTRQRDDVVGLEATIIMSPQIWKASGHVDTFSDPMIDCKTCKGRFRADQTGEIPCPQKPSKTVSECHGEKTAPRAFNLMFQTYVGPVQDASAIAYLRPETAQAIFAQFKNVLETSRQKVPFGIAQVGKAFRNEVTPRNYTFRSREFEQMELEFFIKPDEVVEAIAKGRVTSGAELRHSTLDTRHIFDGAGKRGTNTGSRNASAFYEGIGLPRNTLVEYWQKPEELAHYARATVDILYKFPFSKRDEKGELTGEELEGIAARSDFDLSQHERFSGKPMGVFDEELRASLGQIAKSEAGRTLAALLREPKKISAKNRRRRGAGVKRGDRRREQPGQGPVHPARHRAVRRRGPAYPGVDLQCLPRRPDARRKGQDGNARGAEISSARRADQGGRAAVAQEQARAREKGAGSARPAASAHECVSTTTRARLAAATGARTRRARRSA